MSRCAFIWRWYLSVLCQILSSIVHFTCLQEWTICTMRVLPSAVQIIWASSVIDCKRTTNGCECFHNQFGSMFYNSHPNIFEFMEKLKCTQTRSYLKIRASNAMVPLPKREKERIDKLLELRR